VEKKALSVFTAAPLSASISVPGIVILTFDARFGDIKLASPFEKHWFTLSGID
jgi:hypothetical protein